LGEHLPYKQGVAGSSPAPPIYESPASAGFRFSAGDDSKRNALVLRQLAEAGIGQ
jgi:hypothetical protein